MELELHVNAESHRKSSKLADELLGMLKSYAPWIEFTRKRVNESDMELGAILIAILSAKSVVELAKDPAKELAKGIAHLLEKRRATITIGADGEILAENLRPEDVLPVLRLILAKNK